ncbi:MAG TPA: methyltransferase [Lachnospiraceae bacterium]|nr:methyltransferase [Lachnospiraceae bacterium]
MYGISECRSGDCRRDKVVYNIFVERKRKVKSTEEYMQGLKQWLRDTSDAPLEEMADFFVRRLDDYEEHMSIWERSYQKFAELLPSECREILDLGCGTGLELDKIWQKNPDIEVTGVDLCQDMLQRLLKKHPDKRLTAVCQDYFRYDFGNGRWDAVISFESLHHFLPERKRELYQKIYHSLREGGIFLLGDYIACCDEEEELLRSAYREKREQNAISEDCFVHFDIPLTLEHELKLLREAGFQSEEVWDEHEEATIIIAKKGG